ncbi:MAG TPA: hypothetical protein PK177_13970 [Burkholderiaceae bacterium]|nr:hypothetical protein [Burkholderiaceae bacterium]
MMRYLRQADLAADTNALTALAMIVGLALLVALVAATFITLLDLAATGDSSLLRAIAAFAAELDRRP